LCRFGLALRGQSGEVKRRREADFQDDRLAPADDQ
jgi:hypothetical protein